MATTSTEIQTAMEFTLDRVRDIEAVAHRAGRDGWSNSLELAMEDARLRHEGALQLLVDLAREHHSADSR